MNAPTRIVAGLAGLTGVALGVGRAAARRRWTDLTHTLRRPPGAAVFTDDLLRGLPEPARRYLRHAIAPETPLARSVALHLSGQMRPGPDAARVDLTAEQVLAPPRGFVWEARAKVGPVPVRVRDHYLAGEGGMEVKALGVIPVAGGRGPEVARSARHRLAAEAVWMPAALVPGPWVSWEALDETCACATLIVDGEAVPLTLSVDETGRLREITLMRYGDVGVEAFQLIPYGFRVEAERTFGGYTIPSRVRGGWWYGTERHDPEADAVFEVEAADFGTEGHSAQGEPKAADDPKNP